MTPTFKYLILTLKHKFFVFRKGLKLGVPLWRLIKHDWTKLLPSELSSYGRQFFGDGGDPLGFAKTWLKHQNAHDHHYEWWIPRTGHNRCNPPYPDNEPLPMDHNSILEMFADWISASITYEGKYPTRDSWKWFNNNFDKIRLHKETREHILKIYERWID